jgi:hypothetical protein
MFISELFEAKSAVPNNPKQKQGPAGQARGTDKAPFRNKLVGEASAHAKEVAKKRAEYERAQDKKRDERGETYNVGNAKAVKPPKTEAEERMPQHADTDFAKPMFEFGDVTQIKVGMSANHGLIGNVRVLRIIGHKAEVSAMKGGKHYHVELSSLRPGELNEGDNPQDEVTMDVPLLIRLLEYAREDAKTDMDLHNVAEQLIKLSGQGCLSMDQYDQIVGGVKEMAPGREHYAGRKRVPGFMSDQ